MSTGLLNHIYGVFGEQSGVPAGKIKRSGDLFIFVMRVQPLPGFKVSPPTILRELGISGRGVNNYGPSRM